MQKPYYRKVVQQIINTLFSLNSWFSIMNTYALFLDNNLFSGTIIITLVGIPLMILINLKSNSYDIPLLLVNVNKMASVEQIIQQTNMLIMLSDENSLKSSNTIVDGFLENHKMTCEIEDCPLKIKKNQ